MITVLISSETIEKRNIIGEIVNIKSIFEFIGVVFILVIGIVMLNYYSELSPNNSFVQSFKGNFEFIVRLLIDWSSPDPTLWLIRIVILFAVGLSGWRYINYQPRE